MASPKAAPRGLESGLMDYSGNWTQNEVSHLLKRTMFGAKKSDVDYFLQLSCSEAVDELLLLAEVRAAIARVIGRQDAVLRHHQPRDPVPRPPMAVVVDEGAGRPAVGIVAA